MTALCRGLPALAQDNPLGLIDPTVIGVCTMGDAKRYAFTQADGSFTGFDSELILNVVARAGYPTDKAICTGQDFAALMPSVANGRFDVAVAAIGTTEKRKETVDFPDGYLAGYLTILSANESLKDADALAGKRLGVVQGTLLEIYATKNFLKAELVKFPDNNSAVVAPTNGSVDAHFLDCEAAKVRIPRTMAPVIPN